MNRCVRACGDQAGTAGGLHAVQGDRSSVDGIVAAALDNRERPLHKGAHHQIAISRHRFTVESGAGDGFNEDSAVVGDADGAEY